MIQGNQAREPELISSVLIQVDIEPFNGIPFRVELPPETRNGYHCVALIEDAFWSMKVKSANSVIGFSPLFTVAGSVGPAVYTESGIKQIVSRLVPEHMGFNSSRSIIYRHQDRGSIDSVQFAPLSEIYYTVTLDKTPFVATYDQTKKTHQFFYDLIEYEAKALTLLLRVNSYI